MDQADQLSIRDQIVEQHFHLDRAKAGRQGCLELPADFLHQACNRAAMRGTRLDCAIRPQLFPTRAAHQLVDRQAKLFACQIVQGDVDGGKRDSSWVEKLLLMGLGMSRSENISFRCIS